MTKWELWNDVIDGLPADPISWAVVKLESKVEDEHIKVWRYLQTHWGVAKDLTTDIRQWYQQLQPLWKDPSGARPISSLWAAGKALSDPNKPELAKELVGVVTDVYSRMGIWGISDKTALAVLMATGDGKLLDVIRSKHPALEEQARQGWQFPLDAFEAGLTELEKPLALFVKGAGLSGHEGYTAKSIISSLESRGTKICLPYLKDLSERVESWLSDNPSHNVPARVSDPNDVEWVSYRRTSLRLATTIEAIQHRLPRGDIG